MSKNETNWPRRGAPINQIGNTNPANDAPEGAWGAGNSLYVVLCRLSKSLLSVRSDNAAYHITAVISASSQGFSNSAFCLSDSSLISEEVRGNVGKVYGERSCRHVGWCTVCRLGAIVRQDISNFRKNTLGWSSLSERQSNVRDTSIWHFAICHFVFFAIDFVSYYSIIWSHLRKLCYPAACDKHQHLHGGHYFQAPYQQHVNRLLWNVTYRYTHCRTIKPFVRSTPRPERFVRH